ncbi:MAG: hypothetical protein LBK47_08780 [Prevotellaceae bacterium]|nr:hypothetical protein [Prevotellaceae bacterium]
MKKIAIYLLLTTIASFALAHSYKKDYDLAQKDSKAQEEVLEKWEKEEPDNPEMLLAAFDYYSKKGREEVVTIDENPIGRTATPLKGDNGAHVGYMNHSWKYDRTNLATALQYIDKGITRNPDRIDMRIQKITVLTHNFSYDAMAKELVKMLEHSVANENAWRWIDGKRIAYPKEYMLSTTQAYFLLLYNKAGERQMDNLSLICKTTLKYYPNDVESSVNLGLIQTLEKNYEAALLSLHKANKIKPNDPVILNDIAYCYQQTNDIVSAIKYYEQVVKYASGALQDDARARLKALRG